MPHLSLIISFLSLLSLPLPLYSLNRDEVEGIPGSQVATENGASLLRGTLNCFRKCGTWNRTTVRRKIPWIRESYGRETQCDDEDRQIRASNGSDIPQEILEETQWEWKVPKCPWENLNYEKFCRAMWQAHGKDAGILIVGDELSWGMERRFFYNMLAVGPGEPLVSNLFPEGCSVWDGGHEKRFCSGYRYCADVLEGHTVTVRFLLNRNLSSSRVPDKENGAPWFLALSFWRPSVVVLTHTKRDEDEKSFMDSLEESYVWLRKHYATTLVIYRSNPAVRGCPPPGHQSDESFSETNERPEMEVNRKRQNEIAKKLTNDWGGLFLDVDEAIEKRDGKNIFVSYNGGRPQNCINLCHPGPLDAWVQLLYNTLIVALPPVETKNDIDTSEKDVESYVPSKLAKISIEKYVRTAPKTTPTLKTLIPGSKIRTREDLETLNRKFECFSRMGKWVYNPKPRLLAWPRKPLKEIQPCDVRQVKSGGVFGSEADEIVYSGGNWSVREDLKWNWKTPKDCPLEKFSREKFCKMMGPGRSILFIGDSMSIGFYRSFFFNLLVGHDTASSPPIDLFPGTFREWDVGLRRAVCEGYSHCHEYFGENKGVEIRLCFNRGLTLTEVPVEGEAPFVLKLEEWRPHVVVLNRGAHYREDAQFEKGVREGLRYIRERLPKALIVWRNTALGHANCMSYDGPLSSPQPSSLLPPLFHWADFRHQNKIARKYVEEVGAVYMDVESSSSLRPDGHRGFNAAGVSDCLHYCQPGIPDTWTLLMYNFLKELL